MSRFSEFITFIESNDGINGKFNLASLVGREFNLTNDHSVYFCDEFSVRFSSSRSCGFSNTVLSLSNLKKYDDRPFVVCLVIPEKNYLFLANSTFLKKISHSSQKLRINNIRGSFNGSDIRKDFEGILNEPSQFDRLFAIHASLGFDGNLVRLVDATNNISPAGVKTLFSHEKVRLLGEAPIRAFNFISKGDAVTLKKELDAKVGKFSNEILLAALIENVNVRGRVIEYLIAGEDESLLQELIKALQSKGERLPEFSTANELGDYRKVFPDFLTETDIKTKIMILKSNPKAYNIDKILDFLAQKKIGLSFLFCRN